MVGAVEAGKRPVRILALAALISTAGSTAAMIAIAVLIYGKTRSAVWLSVSLLLTFGVTGFLTPFIGIVADRFDRRRLLIGTELAAGLVYVVLIFVDSPTAIVGLVFVEALVAMPASAALRAAVPNVAGAASLAWANGLLSIGLNVGDSIGPLVGGALAATIGVDVVFVANAVTFIVSAALIWSVRLTFSALAAAERKDERDFLGGFRLLRADKVLAGIALAWMVGYFSVDVVLVADLPFAEALGVGAFGFAVMNTVWSASAVVGGWVSRWVHPHRRFAVLVGSGLAIFLGLGLGSLAPVFAVLLLGLALTSVVSTMADVAGDSVVQVRSPDRLRGRTFAAIRGLGWVANTVAFSIAGFLVESMGPRGVYAIGAIAGLVYGAILYLSLRGADLEREPVPVSARPAGFSPQLGPDPNHPHG
jgi:MFS family permease